MQINVNIDDEELTKAITKGIQSLSEETINELAKQAICEFLSRKECVEGLLFETVRNYGYSGCQVDYERPRKWFVDLVKNSFQESEIKQYREVLYNRVVENGESILSRTLANVLAGMLFSDDFKHQYASAISQIDMLVHEREK